MTIIIYRASDRSLISDRAGESDNTTTSIDKLYATTNKAGATVLYALAGAGRTRAMAHAASIDEVEGAFISAPQTYHSSEMIVVSEFEVYCLAFVEHKGELKVHNLEVDCDDDWAIGGWRGLWNRNQASRFAMSAEDFCSQVSRLESLGDAGYDRLSLAGATIE